MTTQTTDATPVPVEPEAVEPTTVEPEAAPDEAPEPKASHEAARYRRQLRDTEAERDQLREQLEQSRLRLVELRMTQPLTPSFAKDQALVHREDLARFTGKEMAQYLTPEGGIDETALTADLDSLFTERKELFKSTRRGSNTVPKEGTQTGRPSASNGWTAAFAKPER